LVSASPASAGGYGGGTLTIEDATLGPGQEAYMSGTGCLAGATVDMRFDGLYIGTTTADGDGGFDLVGTPPSATAAGQYNMTATCGDLVQSLVVTMSGVVSPSTTRSTPGGGGSLTIDDPTLAPGQGSHISGTGCSAGATVDMRFDGQQIATTTADSDGNFDLVGTPPSGTAPGHYTMTATCDGLEQSVVVTVTGEAGAGSTLGSMARTGTDVGPFLRTAAALVLVGTGLVFLARRRSATVRSV
jgi:hypothetical protein